MTSPWSMLYDAVEGAHLNGVVASFAGELCSQREQCYAWKRGDQC